ncbi:MAG: cell wall hydrolase [Reyranella sp.]|nr:MAG: cell wall hydrolase [Reyranella sp.]TBR27520.1 MAG: cell wall hydrolase [Reyranella sp.]
MRYNDRDVFIMALTLYGEARGLDLEGQTKVAWVIRNRAERRAFVGSSWLGTEGAVAKVCLMPWQFSCWNDGDPNSGRLHTWLDEFDRRGGANMEILPFINLATSVLEGLVEDITNGADHYHTVRAPSWAQSWPPTWAKAYGVVACDTIVDGDGETIADPRGHVFYSSLVKPGEKSASIPS